MADSYPRNDALVTSDLDANDQRRILEPVLKPDDSYTHDGVYWADLPLRERIAFVSHVDAAEARKEFVAIVSMAKGNVFRPVTWYFKNAVLPGAGLGLEGYVLFSIGNLAPLFQAVWGTCWGKPYSACNEQWVAAVTYLEVVGIILGQAIVGILGDWIGRRWGLIQDAAIMFLGLVMLTASWGVDLNGWVICYAWCLFFYGIGVGGEYPMTATAAMENSTGAGRISTREDRLHRGRKVTMAFLMQGWGQLFNQIILITLLLAFHNGQGSGPYSEATTQWVFRLSFAIPAVGTLLLVYHRAYKMPLASKQLQLSKKVSNVTGYDTKSLKYTFTFFGSRLLATAGTWFCNDIFFYGNKLFQSQFISVISPGSSGNVMEGWVWNLVNVVVSMAGYYAASFLIDNKLYGRRMMMQVGFFMDFIFFIVPAFHYKYYTSLAGIQSFQAMYFLSSFFNQFGPNSVTFLVAAECFPTPVRATAHGFAAAFGKLGALLASILYNYIDTQTKFYVVTWFGLVGVVLTYVFLPDTTGLDLKEQERRWTYIRSGRESEYHGVAVHPQHLSMWERWRGVGKHYDPVLDYQSRVNDMRKEWEARQQERRDKEMTGRLMDEDDWSAEVHDYFARTRILETTDSDDSIGEKKTANNEITALNGST